MNQLPDLTDLTVCIWHIPHSGKGFLIEIDFELLAYGEPGAYLQDFQGLPSPYPELDLDRPHKILAVHDTFINTVISQLDHLQYHFNLRRFSAGFGFSIYGIKVERGFQTALITWRGKFEEQEEEILRLFNLI